MSSGIWRQHGWASNSCFRHYAGWDWTSLVGWWGSCCRSEGHNVHERSWVCCGWEWIGRPLASFQRWHSCRIWWCLPGYCRFRSWVHCRIGIVSIGYDRLPLDLWASSLLSFRLWFPSTIFPSSWSYRAARPYCLPFQFWIETTSLSWSRIVVSRCTCPPSMETCRSTPPYWLWTAIFIMIPNLLSWLQWLLG